MSRIVKAKLKQNYQDIPLTRRCRECRWFKFMFDTGYYGEPFCTLGYFIVNVDAICDRFETKEKS